MVATVYELDSIFGEITAELDYQDSRWTEEFDTSHTPHDWVTYICKYAGRCADASDEEARKAFVKVAALAVAAIKNIDKKSRNPLA